MATIECKILLIENDDFYIQLISRSLTKLQSYCILETCKTLLDGLNRLKQGNIDIIILALTLPDSDGYDTFQRLHEIFPDIPVIILSVQDDIELGLKIIRNGGENFLPKAVLKDKAELFAHSLQLQIERCGLDKQLRRLANFAEWNTNPIVELNHQGQVLYLNFTARAQFPDLVSQGVNHPLLNGLKQLIVDLLPNHHSDITIFNREIAFENKNFEQQIFVLPNSGIYIYIVDVTERNQLRDQALLSERLATVGTLAAGIAHEINNPIAWILENLRFLNDNVNVLQGFIYVLAKQDEEKNVAAKLEQLQALLSKREPQDIIYKFSEILTETLQGAERIRDIVRDLKGFAHIDKSEITSVNVNEVLDTAINMAMPEFKYRASLIKDFAADLPKVLVNSGKLHQVFLNLIVNAAQAIPEGNIQNNKITVKTRLENNRIRIDIQDTGQGIPADVLPKIFNPFFTTKPVGAGTGLGLTICHEIITTFGGEVHVQSAPGKGTVFTICIPAYFGVESQKPTAKTTVAPMTQQKHILIIDDEPSLIKAIERMLAKHHDVIAVLGGQAGVDMLAQKGTYFDAIVCDLNMPNVSGADLYHRLAESNPGYEKRFIFMTAGVYTPMMKEFLANVKNPILEKPFMPQELLHAIDKIIEKTSAVNPSKAKI